MQQYMVAPGTPAIHGMGQTDWKQSIKYVAMAAAGIAALVLVGRMMGGKKGDSGAASYVPNRTKKKRLTKSELVSELATYAQMDNASVRRVLDAMPEIAKKELKRTGGEIAIPGMVKLRTVKKKATKARKGRNPATGEEITIKAKKASRRVKATPMKPLKDILTQRRKAG